MWIYIVTGESESGDRYGPLAFTKRPSKEKLASIANNWDESEEGEVFIKTEVHGVLLNEGENERTGLG